MDGLEVPHQPAGIPSQGHQRVRVQVVPGPDSAVGPWLRVSQGQIDQPEPRVDGWWHPDISAAEQPRVTRPGSVASLAGAGRPSEAPGNAAVTGAQGVDVAAHARAPAVLGPDQDQPPVIQRPRRGGSIRRGVLTGRADLDLPARGAGPLIQRHDVLTAEGGEHEAVADRDSSLGAGEARRVLPDDFPARAVDGEDVALTGLHVQVAADRDRRALLGRADDGVVEAGLPGTRQAPHVDRRDRGQG